ncbi:T9SS type A sorting domain-containing protein [candidate division KSB1 bacterium]|nr:T9SS type A sorting domain-containing protein [candidate division KSB1 bacterium]
MTTRTLLLLASMILHGSANAVTRNVPAQYATIREAIVAADPHDTVLVAQGTYAENLNFYGKNIVVASHYVLDGNPLTVRQTTIDGSQPVDPDSGSVVAIISGEDGTAELAGFTITGGTGMPLEDDDNHSFYVEGGGIIIENSTPYVHHNLIVGNAASRRPAGITSAGGGGIRCGFSDGTRILNNVVIGNSGRYGGGIVINYAIAEVSNNIIALNSGGQDYGGGGLWTNGAQSDTLFVWNNTIVGNSSALPGGGIRRFSQRIIGGNNIVWGNRSAQGGAQIHGGGASLLLTYSGVQGGYAGTGNITDYPGFADSLLALLDGSPCVDSGDPNPIFNDANGTRNDMGAYGGPRATGFSFDSPPTVSAPASRLASSAGPGSVDTIGVAISNFGLTTLLIENASFVTGESNGLRVVNTPMQVRPVAVDSLYVRWAAPGSTDVFDTLLIFHNDPAAMNPARIAFHGQLSAAADPRRESAVAGDLWMSQNFPNPFNPETELRFTLPYDTHVVLQVFDLAGRLTTTLVAGRYAAGSHTIKWDAGDTPTGMYFARLTAGNQTVMLKMLLLR